MSTQPIRQGHRQLFQSLTEPTEFQYKTLPDGKIRPVAISNRRLNNDEYAASVQRITATRFHVASSTEPSSVREVVINASGRMACSCPARAASCVHRAAVVEFLTPIEISIAEPVECCYGCKVGPSLGCYKKLRATDAQWAQAIGA